MLAEDQSLEETETDKYVLTDTSDSTPCREHFIVIRDQAVHYTKLVGKNRIGRYKFI